MINTHNQSIVIVVVVISVCLCKQTACVRTHTKKLFASFFKSGVVRERFFYVKTIITWELGFCFFVSFLLLQGKIGA